MIFLLTLAATAFADPGYYHPNDIALQSQQYSRTTEVTATAFEGAQTKAMATANALNQWEEALDLLGETGKHDRPGHTLAVEKYQQEFAILDDFANTMAEDFDKTVTAAMEKAITKVAPEAVECVGKIPTTRPLPGMRVPTKDNPDCSGVNHNQAIAQSLDTDETMISQLDEILGRSWPTITIPQQPQPPTAGEHYIDLLSFFETGALDLLRLMRTEDEEARLNIEVAIENGADPATLLPRSRELTQHTAARRAAFAAPILAATDKAMEKWAKKGDPVAGWCVNPPLFGGCVGQDVSRDYIGRLLEDKGVASQIARSAP